DRVEVRLQPQRRHRRQHRVGVHETERDDVETLVALAQPRASVRRDQVNPRRCIRLLVVETTTERDDCRIDLNRDYALSALPQGSGGVIPGPRAKQGDGVMPRRYHEWQLVLRSKLGQTRMPLKGLVGETHS